ncbi:hybrid sensor histidine kinase/response regulator transcription factor [Catalinimonas niigatensis]|uniref:hybrid sensor histidine kinase/response regulator transcription factor n=1 Tax=Catalinimonas niigatensis TaxID=1397264 RepID=UPI00266610E8|nr:hybrid sensor histidine kinase/response regulator transcription factor [Catalinimonas niigatensis]WPP53546.1 response regulator [Catalinimonas niigatensis]
MMKKTLFLYLVWIGYFSTYAQSGLAEFDSLSIDEGFPAATVLSFLRDSRGFMWFGTQDGLIRYDGVKYQVYYSDKNDSTQLYTNHIFHLFEDSQGRIWLSAGVPIETGKTVQVFDPKTERFTRLDFTPIHLGWLYNQLDAQNYILEDTAGALWVKCYKEGIYKIEEVSPENFSITNYKISSDYPQDYSADSVSVLFMDSRQNFWVGTRNGLYLFDKIHESFEKFPYNKDGKPDQITGIVEDKKGNLWINYEQKGLYTFNPDTHQFAEKWPESNPTPWWFNARYLLIDNSDNIWMIRQRNGTHLHASLDRFNINTGQVSRYFESGSDQVTLWHFFHQIDLEGNIWVTSPTSGSIYVYNSNAEAFELVSKISPGIRNLYFDIYKNMWVSNFQEGVWKFHPSNQKMDIISHETLLRWPIQWPNTCIEDHEGKIVIASEKGIIRYTLSEAGKVIEEKIILKEKCNNIIQDKSGKIWASCFVKEKIELVSIDPKSNRLHRLTLPSHIESIRSIAEINDQGMMVASRSNGIFYYDKETHKINWFLNKPNDSNSISSNIFNQITVDDQNRIWVHNRLGFQLFDPIGKNFVNLNHTSVSEKFENIHAVSTYKNGLLWIGAVDGLSLYDPMKGEVIQSYLIKDGFPTKEIFRIICDDKGNLWLGTRFGLVYFNRNNEQFTIFDTTDGLPSNYIYAGCKRANGELVFGGDQGTVIFHPNKLPINDHIPNPVFTEFHLFNKKVSIDGKILSKSISYTDEIVLNHDQNVISFNYAALSFASLAKNKYAYFMEGIDKDWNYVGGQTFANYSGLPPGKYTLKLKASNNDGIWNVNPTTLQLTILPPWWQTGWAYALYGILGVCLLYSLRQYTVKRERLKAELKLQRLEAEKMHEVDQLKSRFFANISHEFRTPLTLLLGPIDKLMTEPAYAKEHSLFSMMQRNAQRLLHLINQLLDLSKLEAGSMQLETKAGDIVHFLQSIGVSFTSLAERQQVEYHVQYPKHHPVVYFDADKLEKIITNLLSNAFKFTPVGGTITFSAQLHPAEEKAVFKTNHKPDNAAQLNILELKVQDSGVGLSEEQLAHVFHRFYQVDTFHNTELEGTGIGLSLVRELVELHKGEVSAESQLNKGSCFRVRLPLWVADFEEVTTTIPVSAKGQNHLNQAEIAGYETYETSETAKDAETPLVLVVEDNADVRAFIRTNLQSVYHLIEAGDGEEGYYKAIEAIPDLILSDVMMPKMDGIDMCRRLKANEKTAHVPVILLTAKASGGDKIEGLETGADDYIIKPFQADELLVRIKNLIEGRQKLRERFSREITLQPSSVAVSSVDEKFLQRVMQIIEEHMADFTFGVERLGQEAGMSRVQLYRKLKALTNHAPGDFISMMRLKRAAELLSQEAGSIAEIAYSVGFNDPSYFTKRFHKQYGQTPSDYIMGTLD